MAEEAEIEHMCKESPRISVGPLRTEQTQVAKKQKLWIGKAKR